MARKSNTQQLTDSILGQHLALSVAAHLARTQLVPDPLSVYDGQHMTEALDVVAGALAKVAPLYVQDAKNGAARELTAAELEGATVRRAATMLALKDGRTFSSVSMRRADLRQAIAILKATGVPGLRAAAASEPAASKPQVPPLGAQLGELETLLRLPLIAPHIKKAGSLAVAIARGTRHGQVANLAMQLVSAVHDVQADGESETCRVGVALARLRAAVEEAERTG